MSTESFWRRAWRLITFGRPGPPDSKVRDIEVVDPFERFENAILRDREDATES